MTVVVKIGGSLIDTAGTVLAEIESTGVPALIIPGGGVFADSVREANLDNDTAHWKAIASMNRYGQYLSTFGFPITESLEKRKGVTILLPEKILHEADPLPHSWDVTSDSIALWVAREMELPLLLIKSREGELSDKELVDAYFSTMQASFDGSIQCANGREYGSVTCALSTIEATRL